MTDDRMTLMELLKSRLMATWCVRCWLLRQNASWKRRTDAIGIFPNDEAIVRLVGALMLETNDEWAVARRYMSLETIVRITENAKVRLPAVAA